jgi:ABC-type cobalt transport system substrate-binding protein
MKNHPVFGGRPFAFGYLILLRLITASLMLAFFSLITPAFGSDKWAGVDEAVVKKIAQEQGRKAWKPVINMDQGDLPLFIFLLAGAVGGFIAGYYWRVLMVERSSSREKKAEP